MMNSDLFIKHLHGKVEEILLLVNTEMINDGDTENESQRCCLINRISDFEHYVNGVQQSDMKSSAD